MGIHKTITIKGDSYLTLKSIRLRRRGQNNQYYKELRAERSKRIQHTKKLNDEITILKRMIKQMNWKGKS